MSRDDGRVHREITLILDRLLAIRRPVVGYWAQIPAAWLDPLYEQKTGSVDPQGQRRSTPLKAETSRDIGGTSDWLVA